MIYPGNDGSFYQLKKSGKTRLVIVDPITFKLKSNQTRNGTLNITKMDHFKIVNIRITETMLTQKLGIDIYKQIISNGENKNEISNVAFKN